MRKSGFIRSPEEGRGGVKVETFLKVIDSCFTENQIPLLKEALRTGTKVYLYGRGLGKSLLAETFQNAGYDVSEPGDWTGSIGPLELRDEEGMVAFCIKNTPKERIPNAFDILLGCRDEIISWVNQ